MQAFVPARWPYPGPPRNLGHLGGWVAGPRRRYLPGRTISEDRLPLAARMTKRIAGTVVVALALVGGSFALAHRALALALTVNSTSDAVDANPGDGVCATSGGSCTLRAAVMEGNKALVIANITLPAGTYTLTIGGSAEDQ